MFITTAENGASFVPYARNQTPRNLTLCDTLKAFIFQMLLFIPVNIASNNFQIRVICIHMLLMYIVVKKTIQKIRMDNEYNLK